MFEINIRTRCRYLQPPCQTALPNHHPRTFEPDSRLLPNKVTYKSVFDAQMVKLQPFYGYSNRKHSYHNDETGMNYSR